MTPFLRVIPRRVLAPDVGISNAIWRKEIATAVSPPRNDTTLLCTPVGVGNRDCHGAQVPLAMTHRRCVQLCCLAMTPFLRVIPRRVPAPDVGISDTLAEKRLPRPLRGLAMTHRRCVQLCCLAMTQLCCVRLSAWGTKIARPLRGLAMTLFRSLNHLGRCWPDVLFTSFHDAVCKTDQTLQLRGDDDFGRLSVCHLLHGLNGL